MSVHYKFKSALSYDTITFDGLHISVRDLKKAILQQKQIGKATDFDLQITNAQSNEVYEDENVLIPKNSSLIVVRIPLTSQQKKAWEKSDILPSSGIKASQGDPTDPILSRLAKTVDLASVEASEADKIQAAITQSTLDYDPSNYVRIKGSNQVGDLPANYRCYKCFQPGHWIKDCKLNAQQDALEIKKSTGIPRSFMVPVEGPEVPGAMMTPTGQFAVPSIEHEARREPIRKPIEPVIIEKPTIPADLICGVCKDLLSDAVLIPCCGNSFCDECIRNVLLESEDHQCPDCREKDVSPDTLIPNRFLRTAVGKFLNKTGYIRVTPVSSTKEIAPASASLTATAAPVQSITTVAPAATVDISKESSVVMSTVPGVPIVTQPIVATGSNIYAATTEVPGLSKEAEYSDDLLFVDDMHHTSSAISATNIPLVRPSSHPAGNAIPSIPAPVPNSSIIPLNNSGRPIRNIAVYTRPPLNPKIPIKPEMDPGSVYHLRKDKPSFPVHNRPDRSGTPTVDERNHSVEPGQQQFVIESLAAPQHQHIQPHAGPPAMFQCGGAWYPRPVPYGLPPPRGPPDVLPYPPGIDEPRLPHHHYRGGYRPRGQRPQYRTHSPANGALPVGGGGTVVEDPLKMEMEMFKKRISLSREKEIRSARRRSRSPSRSYSRSPRSRSPRSRARSRSRTRTRSRTRSRSRSRSRSAPRPRQRSRTPRSMSLSRSRSRSVRSRTFSRSTSRDRHYASPVRRREERRAPSPHLAPPPRQNSPPPSRYYSQRYKEEMYNRGEYKARTGRYTKNQEYYTQEFVRHNERYEAGRYSGGRERERERGSERRYEKRYEDSYDSADYNLREARNWEKTRDREIELLERERQNEYYRDEHREKYPRKREEQARGRPVETIEGTVARPSPVDVSISERDRVLVDLKREPSADAERKLPPKSPERDKHTDRDKHSERDKHSDREKHVERDKKSKEKKKKKKDEEKKKKKKKSKDKGDKKESTPPDSTTSRTVLESEDADDSSKMVDDPKAVDELYGDLDVNVDQTVVNNYSKILEERAGQEPDKDVVLAPLPELSKWEKDDEVATPIEESNAQGAEQNKQVTSEVLKRAENVLFKKSGNPLLKQVDKKLERKTEVRLKEKERPEKEIEKPKEKIVEKEREQERHKEKMVERETERHKERERDRERERERHKSGGRNIDKELLERQTNKEAPRSVAMQVKTEVHHDRSKTSEKFSKGQSLKPSPVRISAKERLGDKIEDKLVVKRELKGDRREIKIEKISKSVIKKEQGSSKDSSRDDDKRQDHGESDKKEVSVVDEEFVPDYEKLDAEDGEILVSASRKRSSSHEPNSSEQKKLKLQEVLKQVVSSDDSDDSSDESEKRRRRKKKKKHKSKKKKRRHSSSDSDSSSSSSDSEVEKKKKKHKHKSHKKSKKKKKSKK